MAGGNVESKDSSSSDSSSSNSSTIAKSGKLRSRKKNKPFSDESSSSDSSTMKKIRRVISRKKTTPVLDDNSSIEGSGLEASKDVSTDNNLRQLSKTLGQTNKSQKKKTRRRKQSPARATKKGTADRNISQSNATQARKRRSPAGKIPEGWSMRLMYAGSGGFPGRKPICQSCNDPIGSFDQCFRYNYTKRQNHQWETVDQYHCNENCIRKLKRQGRFAEFMSHPWTEKEAIEIVRKLES